MKLEYRGHFICLIEAPTWSAEVIETETGTQLPTKLFAEPYESTRELAQRARRLIDIYIGSEASGAPTGEASTPLYVIRS